MLSLRSNYSHIGMGIQIPTRADGGQEPYTYRIAPDGAGGTVDANGVYKAPYGIGVDKIIVEDALGETAELDIFVGTALQLLANVIQVYMGLSDGMVYLFNQKITPVKDNLLRVAVSTLSPKTLAVKKEYEGNDQKISSLLVCPVDITIYSKTDEALLRKEEIIHALFSDYSKRQQELNSFSIGKLPTGFVTLNNVEGSSIPYAYNLTFNLHYVSSSKKATTYFDKFEREILTEV